MPILQYHRYVWVYYNRRESNFYCFLNFFFLVVFVNFTVSHHDVTKYSYASRMSTHPLCSVSHSLPSHIQKTSKFVVLYI